MQLRPFIVPDDELIAQLNHVDIPQKAGLVALVDAGHLRLHCATRFPPIARSQVTDVLRKRHVLPAAATGGLPLPRISLALPRLTLLYPLLGDIAG